MILKIQTIALAVAIAGTTTPAIALPLQTGIYTYGSSSVRIAARDGRVCYQGLSRNGSLTASLTNNSDYVDFYNVNGVDLVVHQANLETLLVGDLHNLIAYSHQTAQSPSEGRLSSIMQRCLESDSLFIDRNSANPFSASP
jgi:Tfp pilus assembly protein FimT